MTLKSCCQTDLDEPTVWCTVRKLHIITAHWQSACLPCKKFQVRSSTSLVGGRRWQRITDLNLSISTKMDSWSNSKVALYVWWPNHAQEKAGEGWGWGFRFAPLLPPVHFSQHSFFLWEKDPSPTSSVKSSPLDGKVKDHHLLRPKRAAPCLRFP